MSNEPGDALRVSVDYDETADYTKYYYGRRERAEIKFTSKTKLHF